MQKGTVLNLKQLNSVLLFFRNNWCLLTLTLMFLSGLIFSSVLLDVSDKFYDISENLCNNFLKSRNKEGFLSVFKYEIVTNMIFLCLAFIFGSSVTGVTFVPLIIAVRGMFFGCIASTIFSKFALKGLAFNAVLLIPTTAFSVIFLIIAAKESINLSLQIIKITLPETAPKNLSFSFNKYCKRFLVLCLPNILSALLSAWLFTRLISYFNF